MFLIFYFCSAVPSCRNSVQRLSPTLGYSGLNCRKLKNGEKVDDLTSSNVEVKVYNDVSLLDPVLDGLGAFSLA